MRGSSFRLTRCGDFLGEKTPTVPPSSDSATPISANITSLQNNVDNAITEDPTTKSLTLPSNVGHQHTVIFELMTHGVQERLSSAPITFGALSRLGSKYHRWPYVTVERSLWSLHWPPELLHGRGATVSFGRFLVGTFLCGWFQFSPSFLPTSGSFPRWVFPTSEVVPSRHRQFPLLSQTLSGHVACALGFPPNLRWEPIHQLELPS